MTDREDLIETHDVLVQNWGVIPIEPTSSGFDQNALLEALRDRVAYLMQHDQRRLLSAMYILDVPEEQFRQATSERGLLASATAVAKSFSIEKCRGWNHVENTRSSNGNRFRRHEIADTSRSYLPTLATTSLRRRCLSRLTRKVLPNLHRRSVRVRRSQQHSFGWPGQERFLRL